jgi:PQQ-like domain
MVRGRILHALCLILLIALGLTSGIAFGQGSVNVTTWHNDSAHTGQNLQETILTPTTVSPTKFGKLFSYPVDGQLYAQPLYVQGVTINSAVHNVVYAATENDSVYAFDADSAALNPNPLWKTSFTSPPTVTAMACTDNDPYCNVYPIIGITGTPVINLANQSMYLIARTKEKDSGGHITFATRLHALNIATGAEQPNSPVTLCKAAAAKGCNFAPYTLASQQFIPQHEMQRPALLLTPYPGTSQGVVYAAFGQFRGWIFAFDAQSLALLAVFCSAPNVSLSGHGLSGFWGSGAAIAADSAGNIYGVTADGVFDVDTGGADYGDTLIKLSLNFNSSTSQYQFQVLDYFSPADQNCRYENDVDLGSGSPMILPTQPGSNPNLVLLAGKGFPCDATTTPIFLMNSDSLGQATGQTVQTISGPAAGYWGGPAYWQGPGGKTYVYYSGLVSETTPPAGDNLRQFTLVNGVFSPQTSIFQSSKKLIAGSTPSISANGTIGGILWAVARQDILSQKPGAKPAVLYAFDATNVGKQLYTSLTNATRDQAGPGVKFVTPTIANGKVYFGTQTELDVYGLLPTATKSAAKVAAQSKH